MIFWVFFNVIVLSQWRLDRTIFQFMSPTEISLICAGSNDSDWPCEASFRLRFQANSGNPRFHHKRRRFSLTRIYYHHPLLITYLKLDFTYVVAPVGSLPALLQQLRRLAELNCVLERSFVGVSTVESMCELPLLFVVRPCYMGLLVTHELIQIDGCL